MFHRVTVLMTSVGTDSFPAVVGALKSNAEREIRVIGVDVRPTAPGLYLADKGYLVPSRNSPQDLLYRLDEICAQEHVDVIYPGSTEDQEFFARQADRFLSRGVRTVVSPVAGVEIANDKLRLSEFARAHGIPCANFESVQNWSEFERAAAHLGFPEKPVVVKMNHGTGAQGLNIVYPVLDPYQRWLDRDNRIVAYYEVENWLKSLKSWPPLHLAEYLSGNEYSVDILCSGGHVLSPVTRLRLSTFYGLALHAQVVDEPEVRQLACSIVEKLRLSFVVNVQIRTSADGIPKLLEINPRIPGTIGLTVASGVNMPYLALKTILGEPFEAPPARLGITILRYWDGFCLPKEDLLQ